MNEWISVKERLPERAGLEDDESEYVLVCESFEHCGGQNVSVCGYGKDGFDKWDNFGGVHVEHITHWMPLPEPPETVEKLNGRDKEDF